MREIKFRAWIPTFTESPENVLVELNSEEIDEIIEAGNPIMQYTGLQDSKGVDIYEGDIVRHHRVVTAPTNYVTGEPQFQENEFIRIGHVTITPSKGVTLNGRQTTFDYNEGETLDISRYNDNPRCWGEMATVIGNIYEDKELIK